MKLDFNRFPNIEVLLRVMGFLFFLIFFFSRLFIINKYGNEALYQLKPGLFILYRTLWFLESFVYLLYLSAYIFRSPARSLGKGFMETIFPFIVAGLPFLMIRYGLIDSFRPGSAGRFQDFTRLTLGGKSFYVTQINISPVPLIVIIAVMLAGTLVSILSLVFLWKSFSIMVEARKFVNRGIYRYIRHPLYLGEMISYLGVLMLRFSFENLLIYITFIFCQSVRAEIEEEKLVEIFPEYSQYQEGTGMFFPKL